MKKLLAGFALAFGIILGTAGISQAACAYLPPYKGDHVTYYNCTGPHYYNWYSYTAQWRCYADWDWHAEFWWGKHDGEVIVINGRTCYA